MILACTWTVQHPNVPEQRNGRDPGLVGDLKWKLKGFLRSAKWMLITAIAPEFVIGIACYELALTKELHQKLQEFASQDQVPWTLTHTYWVNMGGFVIRSGIREDVHSIPYVPATAASTESNLPATLAPTKSSIPGISAIPAENEITSNIPRKADVSGGQESHPTTLPEKAGCYAYHDPYHLTAQQILKLRRKGVLQKLPYIRKEELDDKSKSDGLIKAIAIVQIIWATIQIIVRAVRKIAISQLEVAVIAFATCAIIIYLLYWSKPKGASTVTTILQYQDQVPKDVLHLIENSTMTMGASFVLGQGVTKPRDGSPVQNGSLHNDEGEDAVLICIYAMVLGAAVFGGIHVGAWNFEFPSRIELIFWRCASVFTAALGLITVLVIVLIAYSDIVSTLDFVLPPFVFSYIVARLFLLVEVFRTLCFLPPDAYVSTWTTNIPHVV